MNANPDLQKVLDRIEKAGGKIEMPISDGPLGSYFGIFADKYGIQWMVDFTPN